VSRSTSACPGRLQQVNQARGVGIEISGERGAPGARLQGGMMRLTLSLRIAIEHRHRLADIEGRRT